MTDWHISKIIAHRCGAALAPENTLAALAKAKAQGATWVEGDVRLTRDGEAIMFHDAELNRCTNGRGLVAKTPYSIISKLDAGSWFAPEYAGEKVPTLDQWLKLAADLHLGIILDLKATQREAKLLADHVISSLSRYWQPQLPRPLISSFFVPCLRAMAAHQIKWDLAYITIQENRLWTKVVDELGCVAIHIDHHYLSKRWIRSIKQRGIKIAAYTINQAPRARQLFEWGIDSIFSDVPDLLQEGGTEEQSH